MPKLVESKEQRMIKLDLKDRKILFELDFNSRQSNASLAKKVKLSKQGIDYRIKRLLHEGIIESFYPLIDLTKLGYFYGRIFIKFQNLTREHEKEIYSAVIADSNFKWATSTEGNYDLILATWTQTLSEFKVISRAFTEKFGRNIKDKKESIGTKLVHLQSKYFLEGAKAKEVVWEDSQNRVEIDSTDKKIINALSENARMPIVDIAKRAEASAKSVAYRIKGLEKEGILLGSRPNINHNLLGFTHYKLLFYMADSAKAQFGLFTGYLKQMPNVIYLVDDIGVADIDIEVMLPSAQSFFSFIDKIRFDFPTLIKDYQFLVIKRTLKIGYSPFSN
jgi:Lrp/AsnC family transcriptional regulator, leucine-responsive regulatory protein